MSGRGAGRKRTVASQGEGRRRRSSGGQGRAAAEDALQRQPQGVDEDDDPSSPRRHHDDDDALAPQQQQHQQRPASDGVDETDVGAAREREIQQLRTENRRLAEEAAESRRLAEEEAAENRRLAEENRRLAEEAAESRRLAEEEAESRRLAVESQRLAEEEAAINASIAAGTYYSTIDQVWGVETQPYASPNLFSRLRREGRRPNYPSRPEGLNYYALTADPAVQPQYAPAAASYRSSLPTDVARSLWPTDLFGADAPGADVAHLIPHSSDHASLYFDVALCAFGWDNPTWETLQKTIHGSIMLGGTRESHTGIKHLVPNKIRLSQQGRFFDAAPCVLIIPILNLQKVKNWNGGKYRAVVMVGSWGGEGVDKGLSAPLVCHRIGMTRRAYRTATPEEVEVARTLLTEFVVGLAHSLAHRTGTAIESAPPGSVRDIFEKTRSDLLSSAGNGVVVPAPISRPSTSDLRVYVVRFSNAYDDDENENNDDVSDSDEESDEGNDEARRRRHPAPDPLLVTARAAVTWSRRNHQPLKAAAAVPYDEFGPEWDELDQLAAEQFLEERDRRNRPKDEIELAKGLRQYQNHSSQRVKPQSEEVELEPARASAPRGG